MEPRARVAAVADVVTEKYWDQVWEVFDEALELEPRERAEFVETRTDNADTRAEVQRLLAAHEEERGLLDDAALDSLHASRAPATVEQLPDLTGRVLAGRYELTRILERGGAGVVYVGVDRTDGRDIAIKVLPPSPHGHWRESRSESATLRMLRVAGVVRLLDDGRANDAPLFEYLVTEYVDGRPFPGCETPCEWKKIANTSRALLETLDRIHWAGVLHRDLKPGNVLVRHDGTPVVLDLGISQQRRSGALAHGPTVGTPRYLAPEQLERGAASIQSDLYAVGVMLHEALTGQPPARGVADMRSIAELAPGLPSTVSTLIDQLCDVDPRERPASASEALQRIAEQDPAPHLQPPVFDATSTDGLRPLFAGHERLLHIPEDAARQLRNRSDGTVESALAELDAWERAGLGRWSGSKFEIDRRGIDALRAGLRVSPPKIEQLDDSRPRLEKWDALLLVAVVLARLEARVPLLATALDLDEAYVAARVEMLTGFGYLAESLDGYLRVRQLPATARDVLAMESRGIHRRLARSLPVGSEARVHQFAAADELERVPSEAVEAARALRKRGALPRAQLLLAEALKALEIHPDPSAEKALMELAAAAAVQSGSPAACDHLLFQLAARPPTAAIARLEAIVRGTHHGYRGEFERGLAVLPPVADCHSTFEQRLCASARMFLGRGVSPDAFEALIAQLEEFAIREKGDALKMIAISGRAWLHYRRDEFEEAAEMHLAAADLATDGATRMSILLNAASALLEIGAFGRAATVAHEPERLAIQERMPIYEARAAWITRSARYRGGERDLEPDLDLVHACRDLGALNLTAMLALNEAAIAWRCGSGEAAVRLADIAASNWASIGETGAGLLAQALAHMAGKPLPPAQEGELLAQLGGADALTATIQAAGLLARTVPALQDACQRIVAKHLARLGPASREFCLEVTSISEAMKSVALTP